MDISSISKYFSVSLLQTAVKNYIKPISYLIGALALGIIFRAAYQQLKDKFSDKSNSFSKLSTDEPQSDIEKQAGRVHIMIAEQNNEETDNSSDRAEEPESPFQRRGFCDFGSYDEKGSGVWNASPWDSNSTLDDPWTNPNPSITLLRPNSGTSTIPGQRQIATLVPNQSTIQETNLAGTPPLEGEGDTNIRRVRRPELISRVAVSNDEKTSDVYAWYSNSFSGNEFWVGGQAALGDSADSLLLDDSASAKSSRIYRANS